MIMALLAVGTTVALGAHGAPPVSPKGVSVAANKRAAQRDGRQLLSWLALPAGAKSSQREPHGGGSALANPGSVIASPDVIDQHAWWVVPQSVQTVLAFIRAHRPAGSQLESSGSGGQYGRTTSWSLRFGWQSVPSVLYSRALSVVFVRLPNGSTGVIADASDMWDIPRPARERIPSSAVVLEVAVTRPHTRPSTSITVTDTDTVAKIAALIDALETVQPVAISCPMIPVELALVTFTFRAAQSGPVLAQASEPAGASESISECEPMQLTIAGIAQTPLLGGPSVVARTQALLGVSLR
jgi:hypothetical protein